MEKTILVVDDEKTIRDMLKESFEKNGYSVETAGSGKEAWDILKEKNIHVIFLDLKLPETSGLDLCREIKSANPVACVYAVTGYSSLFEILDCREAGFDDYFTKPVNLSLFLKTAEEAFEKIERWKKELKGTKPL